MKPTIEKIKSKTDWTILLVYTEKTTRHPLAMVIKAFIFPLPRFIFPKYGYNSLLVDFHLSLVKIRKMSRKKGKKKAETVFLVCEETGEYNYFVRKKPGGEKLKLKKYCPRLRKHTIHNEKKK
jgi:large subunit ribosomal protein L33